MHGGSGGRPGGHRVEDTGVEGLARFDLCAVLRGGAHERTLQVVMRAAALGAEDIAGLTAQQHLDRVTAFLGGVLQAATDYLSDPGSDPANDGFGYRQVALWADDEELASLAAALREVVSAAADQGPGEGRRRRVLTTVLLPDAQAGPG